MGVWNDLLASFVASKAPTRSVLLLGGSVKSQNAFIDQMYLEEESFLTPTVRNQKANEFGLGYTYIQYKDESGELLSTLQIFTLPGDYEERHRSLITSIIKSLQAHETLIIPLLDYTESPRNWIRSMKLWISIIDEIHPNDERPSTTALAEAHITVPLGVKVLVAVINTETRPDWEYSKFELIQVYLRIISLVHRFSLIYTSLLRPDPRIPELVSTLLNTEIAQKVLPKLEPNLVDHTEILVPLDVDTLGKIKTINDDINPHDIIEKYDFTRIGNHDDEFTKYFEENIPDIHRKHIKKGNTGVNDSKVNVDISYQEFLTKLYDKQTTSQEGILKEFIHNVKTQSK